MRRLAWVLLLLAGALVAGVALVAPPESARAPVVAGVSSDPSPDLVAEPWVPPDVVGEGWRVRPGKTSTLEFVSEQGGLWRTEIPRDAGGELHAVRGEQPAPRAAERTVTVRVEVETGLGVDGPEFARQVMATLNDPRGWGHDGSVSFARTQDEAADINITLASPATTDRLCAPVNTGGTVSCGRVGFAVLNAVRWAQGAEPFLEGGGTVADYRHYLVNHEVGHVLGHPHVRCPAPGAIAPIMLQQTLTLQGCEPNGWPGEAR